MTANKYETARAYLRGLTGSYTMVFFSTSPVFGIILLIVSFFDLYAGIAGLFSVLTANLTAVALGLNREKIAQGMYGFNALLTGLGLGVALQPSASFYLLLFFIALSTLLITLSLEGILSKYGLPYLSLPFLISIWISMMATRAYTVLLPGESGIFMLNTLYLRGGKTFLDLYLWFDGLAWPPFLNIYFKSLGAILFQYHLPAGILIALGLLVWSRIAFLFSLLGFTSAWVFYQALGADINELAYSFIGFNHILAAIAISFFTVPSVWSALWVLLLTPLVSMLISAGNQLLQIYQLPLFSLPFNLVIVLFLFGLRFRERMLRKPELVAVQQFSPEENLYAALSGNRRFPNRNLIPLRLPFYGYRHINQAHRGPVTHKDRWQHAWDFVIRDSEGREFANSGTALTDYYCFNKPVLAPADGWIQEVTDRIDDNEPGHTNLVQNWGNYVIIRHHETLYTLVCHLKKESVLYAAGTWVHRGQVIAQSGNSGRSPYPHLHFHVQAAPLAGSDTISYPVAHYLQRNGGEQLHLSSIPQMGDEVSNILPDPSLLRAFTLVPGQTLRYTVNGTRQGSWQVHAGLYGELWLQCSETGSRAGFTTDGSLFRFTGFTGKRRSMLYYFYLSAYQVPLGYYENLRVSDTFPPTVLRYGVLRLVHDLTATVFRFLKPGYTLQPVQKTDDIAGNTLVLESTAACKLMGVRLLRVTARIQINSAGLEKMQITDRRNEIILTFNP